MAFCSHCGNELDEAAFVCPACGRPHRGQAVAQRTEPFAIVSLVAGLLGLVMLCPFVGGVLAITFGVIALSRTREDPSVGGRGMATAGIVTGGVGLVVTAVVAVALVPMILEPRGEVLVQQGRIAAPIPAPDARSSVRNALTAAKTIFVDRETYEDVTEDSLSMAEPSLTFVDRGESTGPRVVSFLVVSPTEIRMAADNGDGICYATKDRTGPDGEGVTFAARAEGPCNAEVFEDDEFGPRAMWGV